VAPFLGNPSFTDATRDLLDKAFVEIWLDMHYRMPPADAEEGAAQPDIPCPRAATSTRKQ
jgi:hypothetical protein